MADAKQMLAVIGIKSRFSCPLKDGGGAGGREAKKAQHEQRPTGRICMVGFRAKSGWQTE